ncbi:MAG: DUF721 domain-containing protein [Deltaproteobacteria bacterium]|nr:DUF721 domain-containing protein [Deltaproteobacteria bacterium]
MNKEILPFKAVVQELLTGKDALVDPLIPAVIDAWIQAVPESLRSGIYMEGIREGTLYLSVSNPVVGQQFQFLKDSIRGKINETLGKPVVKTIRLKPGSVEVMSPGRKEKTDSTPPRPRSLSKKEKLRIQHICAEIKDPEVRERVRAAMEKSRCYEPAKRSLIP